MKFSLCLLIIMLYTCVHADDEVLKCVSEASKKYNIAEEIIDAIISEESGCVYTAINIAGTGYYPIDENKAKELITAASSDGRSFDIGVMQINKWWFDRFQYEYSWGLDKCFNVHFGTWILAYEVSRHGYTYEAIGRYHSHTDKYKLSYVDKIKKRIRSRISACRP
ncbi:hypothetical protein ADMFC3_27260 [Geovibrio sp. ADMFC3]